VPRRTLIVTNDFPPRVGGIESFVLAMAQRMDPAEVAVHTARQAGDAAFDATLAFPVIRDPSRLMVPTPAITNRAVDVARDMGCDAVWFGAAAPLGLMAGSLKRKAGVRRTVATTHGHEVWWAKTPGTRQLLHRIGESNDVLTYLGDYTRSQVARALSPAAVDRMVQLTPGVDTTLFDPSVDGAPIRELYGLGDRPVVLCVSRFVERKGQDVLVEALPLIQREVPQAALLLVGDGPMRDRLVQLAEDRGVSRDVVFAGAQPWAETPPFYTAADVFCMPCRTRKGGLEVEALGIVFLEAAAAGLPVVVGNSGGAPDAVLDGRSGYVVDGTSPEAVARSLINLLAQPDLAAALGKEGRAWVREEWRWDQMARRLERALVGVA
jgi:phosphatidylinositol alpha-1,6-mannosyltransferase